jgi:hypothetical protein
LACLNSPRCHNGWVAVLLPRIFRLRQKSLVRGIVLALGAFAVSLRLAGFPDIKALHSSPWQAIPALLALCGMFETARCLSRKWSLYHAGVLLLLYTDLMILTMVLFVWFLA